MSYQVKLPDIGEGIAEGEIVKWLVKEGDSVKQDQPIVEVMTDKVNVQIPSPKNGIIRRILAQEGQMVKVGQAILEIDAEGQEQAEMQPPSQVTKEEISKKEEKQTVQENVIATPSVRRLARELSVDITKVKGSGPLGRITEQDVKAYAQQRTESATQMTETVTKEKEEEVEIYQLRGVRRNISEHLVKARNATVAVTHVDEADVTELVSLREALKGPAEKKGVKLTYLPIIMKALIPVLKEFPFVNASLDDEREAIVLKKYYNIGIATDTEQGLIVPVIKNVDKKDVFQIASELNNLAEKARNGALTLDEVKGSTFSITNPGTFGGLFATPMINWPDVAILGIYKISKRPVVKDGEIQIRDTTYLSLTFDHRVIDGAYAARFMSRLIEILQDPKRIMSEVL
ncbi:MAG: dihydrolipoamide acetyltransferase family protein [Nitrososphaerota archaeon]